MPILNDYLDVVEASSILNIHWETVKRLCRENRIQAQKVHNKWLIHKNDLDQFARKYNVRSSNRKKHLRNNE